MSLSYQVLQLSDLERIQSFERGDTLAEDEPFFAEWTAAWRKESLEHYLPLGWSFGVFEDEKLRGYFLAQPLLFFRQNTQTLWVEHMRAETPEDRLELAQLARNFARDKHLQQTLFHFEDAREGKQFLDTVSQSSKDYFAIQGNCVAVNTTKISPRFN